MISLPFVTVNEFLWRHPEPDGGDTLHHILAESLINSPGLFLYIQGYPRFFARRSRSKSSRLSPGNTQAAPTAHTRLMSGLDRLPTHQ